MDRLSDDLVNRVLAQLGISKPAASDLASLQQLYAAWSLFIPFDNTRKLVALRSGTQQTLPGIDASDFFEHWLKYGSGGTCWPVANAFYELLVALGYAATRIAGSMRDMGVLNHASVKVIFDDKEWLAEASLLLNTILPLGGDTIIHQDPVCPVELEKENDTWLLWMKTPPNEEYYACRLHSNPLDRAVFEERYEASRTTSVFNQRIYAKRNYADRMIVLFGNARYSKTSDGLELRELTRDELCEALHNDIGISYELINEWAACGGLEASFEKPSGPRPPAATKLPPSLRQILQQYSNN